MLKVEMLHVYGLAEAVHGMRNPLNSWSKSDSRAVYNSGGDAPGWRFTVGKADRDLMKRLCDAGEEHRKWMRMVVVYVDIIAPLYWWKEFDTYKVGTVTNSCSTMHTLMGRPLTLDDFSHDMIPERSGAMDSLLSTIRVINELMSEHKASAKTEDRKSTWYQVIQLLPTSFNQRRTVMLNLEVCYKICKQREGHKLDEWKTLIDFLRSRVVLLNDLTS